MTKRMLIDASHAEETRVVVLDGSRLEEFDLEAATRRPLKGNIYLAKVVRVEPSLQAAFVEYGGNRHGFLAFGEIHPDYYQLPIADRQRLLEMQAEEAREEEEAEERAEAAAAARSRGQAEPPRDPGTPPAAFERPAAPGLPGVGDQPEIPELAAPLRMAEQRIAGEPADAAPAAAEAPAEAAPPAEAPPEAAAIVSLEAAAAEATVPHDGVAVPEEGVAVASPIEAEAEAALEEPEANGEGIESVAAEGPPPETIGGEGPEEDRRERRIPPRFLRHYKIQEVIKRRQIMLVQVVKEERGTKGAALTTYVSLAGRFSVLMPNSPRGGGVSRKITSAADRKRLREIIEELGLPDGMSLIVRTAGAQRPKPEIKRDCEYLLRLWDNIRERTLASTAPALIYEEADLIKRSIRDVYARDVEEVIVDGDEAFQHAREFMRMLMPSHVKKVQQYRDGGLPLFARHQVESQLDAMHSPTVQLRSGGYLVINQTEALVAIDVNSGRATRDRHIEDTAYKVNLEAADEIARQLRLRDLAGLIVIDFIDMESSKHDAAVERRLKEALKHDRARIQVGRISHFGLLEMSRQRLRPSLAETTFVTCPHCQGRGQVRSLESSALTVLRAIEEEGGKRRSAEIVVHVAGAVAMYLLNRKRDRLVQIEERFGMNVLFEADDTLVAPALRIERVRAQEPGAERAGPSALRMDYAPEPEEAEPEEPEAEAEEEVAEEAEPAAAPRRAEAAPSAEADANGDRRRRRRRRRRGRREDGSPMPLEAGAEEEGGEEEDEAEEAAPPADLPAPAEAAPAPAAEAPPAAAEAAPPEGEEALDAALSAEEEEARRRRRGRRGGRRRRGEGEGPEARAEGEEAPPPPAPVPAPPRPPAAPRYQGPTPADPFAGQIDDIFDAMAAAEAAAEAEAAARAALRRTPGEAVVAVAAVVEVRQETVVALTAPPAEAPPASEAPPAAEALLPAVEAEAPPAVEVQPVPAEVGAAPAPAEAAPPAVSESPSDVAPPAAVEPPAVVAPPAVVEPPAAAAAAAAPAPEPSPAEAAAPAPEAPRSAPPVQPVLVTAEDEAAPRRRGWWKR